jgi:aspartyl protease/PDZ domain-containing protein
MRRVAVAGAIAFCFGLVLHASEGQKPLSVVPFQLVDSRIFVNIKINGQGPFHCILDTGADFVITPETAKRLGLQSRPQGTTGGTGEKQVDVSTAHVGEVKVGNAVVRELEAAVINTSDCRNVFGSVVWDATLGLPLFQKYAVKIDYEKQRVTFFEPGEFSAPARASIVPFELPLQIPVVKVRLDGVAGRMGVDTGARSSLLLYGPFVEANQLREKYEKKMAGITGWGIGGPIRSEVARGGSLRIGEVVIREPLVRLPLQKSGLTTGTHLDGLIGPDVLSQFVVYFNYEKRWVALEKSPRYGARIVYDRLGAWLGQGEGSFTVLDVVKGGPAEESGLRVGDEIWSVDGKPAAGLVLPEVRDRMRTANAGTKVSLEIRKGEGRKRVEVVLQDLI